MCPSATHRISCIAVLFSMAGSLPLATLVGCLSPEPVPGGATAVTWIPSEAAPGQGIVIRLVWPELPRYPEGTAVVEVPGAHLPGGTELPRNLARDSSLSQGLVQVTFAFPGGGRPPVSVQRHLRSPGPRFPQSPAGCSTVLAGRASGRGWMPHLRHPHRTRCCRWALSALPTGGTRRWWPWASSGPDGGGLVRGLGEPDRGAVHHGGPRPPGAIPSPLTALLMSEHPGRSRM